jgi:hypothetical protein
MLINYTSPVNGKSLYHLVFIGEEGAGKIKFLVKTEFGNAGLEPVNSPSRVYPDNETALTSVSNATDLRNATSIIPLRLGKHNSFELATN